MKKKYVTTLFLATLCLAGPTRLARAGDACAQAFAALGDPRRLAQLPAQLFGNAWRIFLKAGPIPYRDAYRSGATPTQGILRTARRVVLAPRVKSADPEELKKFQFGALISDAITLNPFFSDSATEVISKGLVAAGKRPLESRPSIPVNMAMGTAAGVATYAFYVSPKEDRELDTLVQKQKIGSSYTQDWARVQGMSSEDALKVYYEHSRQVGAWLSDVKNGKNPRALPPRLYQFQLMGLCSPPEREALETVLLATLRDPKVNDDNVQAEILRRINLDPLLSQKPPQVKQLLSLALFPPLSRGEGKQSYGWIKAVREGKTEEYRQKVLPQSDLALLYATLPGQPLEAVGSSWGSGSLAEKAEFAFRQTGPAAATEIAEKKAAAGFLPPGKKYLAERSDFPSVARASSPWTDQTGHVVPYAKELDYWRALELHPAFRDLKKKWESGSVADEEALTELQSRMSDLAALYVAQEDKLAEARAANPARDLPFDPSPVEVCALKKMSPAFAQTTREWSSEAVPEDRHAPCEYLTALSAWRYYAWLGKTWRHAESVPDADYDARISSERARLASTCRNGDFSSLQTSLGAQNAQEMLARLRCD